MVGAASICMAVLRAVPQAGIIFSEAWQFLRQGGLDVCSDNTLSAVQGCILQAGALTGSL